ncbi:MAG: hypothetical protein Q9191_001836 [Dirinaria sp. TL-2023a]
MPVSTKERFYLCKKMYDDNSQLITAEFRKTIYNKPHPQGKCKMVPIKGAHPTSDERFIGSMDDQRCGKICGNVMSFLVIPEATIIITAQKYRRAENDPNSGHVYKASVTYLEPGKNLRDYVTSVPAYPSVEEVVRTLHYETLRKLTLLCERHPLSRLKDFIFQPLGDRERLFEANEQRCDGIRDENCQARDALPLRTSRQNVMAGTGGQEQAHSAQPVNTSRPSFGHVGAFYGNGLLLVAGPSMASYHGNNMNIGAGLSHAHGPQYYPSRVYQNLSHGLQGFNPGPASDFMATVSAGPVTGYYMNGALPNVDAGPQCFDPTLVSNRLDAANGDINSPSFLDNTAMDGITEVQGFSAGPIINSMVTPSDNFRVLQYSNHPYMDINTGLQDLTPGPINDGMVTANGSPGPQNSSQDLNMDVDGSLQVFNIGPVSDGMSMDNASLDPLSLMNDHNIDANAALSNDHNPGKSSDLMNGAHEYIDPRLLDIRNLG